MRSGFLDKAVIWDGRLGDLYAAFYNVGGLTDVKLYGVVKIIKDRMLDCGTDRHTNKGQRC